MEASVLSMGSVSGDRGRNVIQMRLVSVLSEPVRIIQLHNGQGCFVAVVCRWFITQGSLSFTAPLYQRLDAAPTSGYP